MTLLATVLNTEWSGRLFILPTAWRVPIPTPVIPHISYEGLNHRGILIQRKFQRHYFALSASANDDPRSQSKTKVATAELPTVFERMTSALMFVLPLSEGLFRMALSTLQLFKNQSLQFMFWFHHQHRQLTHVARSSLSSADFDTLETLLAMSEKMHKWFSAWTTQLLSLSGPIIRYRESNTSMGWLSMSASTPEALWQLGCLFYMSVLAAFAAFRLTRHSNEPSEQSLLFRKPQVISLSYFCALLMRMSWTPMEGMSDLSLDLYWVGASLLTALTTGCAFFQMHSLLFSRMPKLAQFLETMAREVTWIAQLHRSFLLLDWLLCLFSSQSLEGKCFRSLLLMVYWMTVNALEGAANSIKQWSLKV